MANTKKETFTKIPNYVLDALISYRLPGEERQCLDLIIRKTLGWNKTIDNISISQFHEATGIKKPNIIRALKSLKMKKIIIVSKKDNKKGKRYRFNLKIETWEPFTKKSANRFIKNDNKSLVKKRTNFSKKANETLSKALPTKEIKKKENKNPSSKYENFEIGFFDGQYYPSKEEWNELKRRVLAVAALNTEPPN
jgi:phage replication O-like protein O